LGMGAHHAYTLARNSFSASFASADAKAAYRAKLDEFFETFEPHPDALRPF
jgi:adenosine deaminase